MPNFLINHFMTAVKNEKYSLKSIFLISTINLLHVQKIRTKQVYNRP